MASVSGPTATLADLPFELTVQIMSNDVLSHRDWKRLRLDKVPKPRISLPDETGSEFLADLMMDATLDPDLFWLPRCFYNGSGCRENIVENFLPHFFKALGRLPRLTTFLSCPMPNGRVFPYREYPLQPDMYRFNNFSKPGNDGFFSFMLPAMSRAGSRIRSLGWADEETYTSLTSHLRPEASDAFSALTSINLCISRFPPIDDEQSLPTFISCLSAATDLTHLSLCFERSNYRFPECLMADIFSQCHWPHLTSLHLMDVKLRKCGFHQFFKNHSSLRHLALDSCQVLYSDISAMGCSPNLRLDSITIRSGYDNKHRDMSEKNLLHLINKESTDLELQQWELESKDMEIKTTTEFAHDHHAWSTAVHFDWRNQSPANDESDGNEDIPDEDDEDNGEFKNTQPPTYWAWDRFHGGDVYYWPVEEENAAQAQTATEYWQFTTRDGATAFGSEPLEYFSDWDSDAGDVATPTPYCQALFDFGQTRDIVREPPHGAERYNVRDHPPEAGFWRPSHRA
ncbi:hypothetical protein F4779DRAFT_612922 [Xylariaceae sp. FL0662B]|nr:hypothetical protein F4779DRAFT_612922 [Xylariaceae sp. FL0662B]